MSRLPNVNARTIASMLVVLALPLADANAAAGGFERAAVHLERNMQDHDIEALFEVIGAEDGLSALKVLSPDGRPVIDFKTPASKLGIRHLTLESPELTNDRLLRADFPAGIYHFEARTTSGTMVRAKAELTHDFPAPVKIEHPAPGQKDLAATGLTLRWTAPDGLAACLLVVEQPGSSFEIKAHLPGTAREFTIPDGFLHPGTSYRFAIGTVSPGGNRTIVEADFVTESPQKLQQR
jgi:hypothetical protein